MKKKLQRLFESVDATVDVKRTYYTCIYTALREWTDCSEYIPWPVPWNPSVEMLQIFT